MTDISQLSSKFSNMGFVCVCLVVLMHVHCPWEGGGINRLAVPFFFAMSGYFLAAHVDEQGWYRQALAKRIRTLVVPLFAWCLIWVLFTVPLAVVCNIRAGRDLYANLFSGWEVLRYLALDITDTPSLGPLWYVRCLFLFVVISPMIVLLIRNTGFLPLLIFGALYCIYSAIGTKIRFLSYGFSLEGVFYFTMGMFLRMRHVPLMLSPKIGAVVFAIGLLAYFYGLVVVSIALMIVGLWGLMPTRRFPKILVANTFPVYLIHLFVLVLFGNENIDAPLFAIGVGFVAVVLSIAVAEAVRKIAPRMAIVLFGGR